MLKEVFQTEKQASQEDFLLSIPMILCAIYTLPMTQTGRK